MGFKGQGSGIKHTKFRDVSVGDSGFISANCHHALILPACSLFRACCSLIPTICVFSLDSCLLIALTCFLLPLHDATDHLISMFFQLRLLHNRHRRNKAKYTGRHF